MMSRISRSLAIGLCALTTLLVGSATVLAQAPAKKPNILVIWGDDIGYWNLSAYNQGMMGYKTPNIDRIAKEGALFTDWYGQQSCTAGRAAFITGQSPFRTGLLKVGLPGAKEGLQARDVTIAELLKAQGYLTGQFGKNHLGDLDEHWSPVSALTAVGVLLAVLVPLALFLHGLQAELIVHTRTDDAFSIVDRVG
jgi:arylsulfatase